MRRILFPLLVIGLAGGLFTLGSGAFFSDSETDTGNTITAGTLTLDVTSPFATVACSSTNLTKPGDGPATCTNTVQNSGSITGDLYLKVTYNNTADLGAVLTVAGGSSNTGTGANTAAGTTWGGNTTWKTLALACVNVAEFGGWRDLYLGLPDHLRQQRRQRLSGCHRATGVPLCPYAGRRHADRPGWLQPVADQLKGEG